MKTWKQKVDIPGYGICIVKEYRDREVERARKRKRNYFPMPIDHGFVNLFHGNKFVAVCGSNYAKQRIIRD